KLARAEVSFLGEEGEMRTRERLISEIMLPAGGSEAWGEKPLAESVLDRATSGLALLEAAQEHEEALAIACLLREAIEKEGATAALVTPDRRLARLVAAELKRFGLDVDDTAGTPLNVAQAAIFAQLIVDAARNMSDYAAILGLLRHPLCALGQGEDE